MSLVFAAITPCSPLTLTDDSFAKSRAALKELEGELYVMQPDVLFVISPLAPMAKDAFLINLANEYVADVQEHGNTLKPLNYGCDIELISKLREYADGHNYGRANIINQSVLDHGIAVPLYHLAKHLPHIKIVPISLALGNVEEHYKFGHILRHVANESNKRVAVIGSLQLSVRPNHKANPDADTYDHAVVDLLKKGSFNDIIKLNASLIDSAEAIYSQKVLALLAGTFQNISVASRVLCYEIVNDTSHLVVQFNLI
ncbi:MAG: hypothetical protein WCW27_04090 [Patescibacteria group bacterium]|jgi:aromatic ring-opening dioxygenase LigB subunit